MFKSDFGGVKPPKHFKGVVHLEICGSKRPPRAPVKAWVDATQTRCLFNPLLFVSRSLWSTAHRLEWHFAAVERRRVEILELKWNTEGWHEDMCGHSLEVFLIARTWGLASKHQILGTGDKKRRSKGRAGRWTFVLMRWRMKDVPRPSKGCFLEVVYFKTTNKHSNRRVLVEVFKVLLWLGPQLLAWCFSSQVSKSTSRLQSSSGRSWDWAELIAGKDHPSALETGEKQARLKRKEGLKA